MLKNNKKLNRKNKKRRFFAFAGFIFVLLIFSVFLFSGKEDLRESFLEEKVVFHSIYSKNHFKSTEELRFDFTYEHTKQRNGLLANLAGRLSKENEISIKGEIIDFKGEIVDVYNAGAEYLKKEKISFKFSPEENNFKPGKYSFKVTAEKNGKVLGIKEQDFTWGVLTINFNKSIYTFEDEQAYIQMGVLNDRGNTICNAMLEMEIISPQGNVEYFSTDPSASSGQAPSASSGQAPSASSGQAIEYSGQCSGNSYVEVPDYFAYFNIPEEEGEYRVQLTAHTINGERTITDSFEVKALEYDSGQASVPFDVERIGPTRIYPPADYEVKMIIKANEDFEGKIVEQVPASFEIINHETYNLKLETQEENASGFTFQVSEAEDKKHLIWSNVQLEKGDVFELSYTFNAPNISPYLFLLGPLQFYENVSANNNEYGTNSNELNSLPLVSTDEVGEDSSQLVFKELRSWQIASDDVTSETRFLRGDTHTINGLSAYNASTTQSNTAQNNLNEVTGSGDQTVTWGIQVWERASGGTETEITGGTPVAQVSRSANGSGIQSNTWTPATTSLDSTDSIVIRVYSRVGTDAWTVQANFTTEQLDADQLDNEQWTVYYYTEYATLSTGQPANRYTRGWFHWGNSTYNSRITDFSWSTSEPPGTPGTPTYDDISTSTLKVEWAEPTGGGSAVYYELERADDDNGSPDTFSFIATTTELYYNDSGRSPNTAYWYRVKAINNAGESDFSTSSSVLTLPGNPGTPTYDNISTSTLTVNWVAPTGGADYYELERADDDNGSPDTFAFVATTTNTSYGDSGLTSGTTYWYRVRAINETGTGEYSNHSDVTTPDAPPGTPGTPTYSNITHSSLRISWAVPVEGGSPEYYELERADDDNGSPDTFAFVATTTELYYDDSGLEGSSVYWYRVKAVNTLGESDFSEASSASTFAEPGYTILKGGIRIKGGTIIR